LLATEAVKYEDLFEYLTKPILNIESVLGAELKNYLDVIKPNLEVHGQIAGVLLTYNNNFIRTTHDENFIYIQLLELTKKTFTNLDASILISSLFATFFVHALNTYTSLDFLDKNCV
jgi:hypothetical protein